MAKKFAELRSRMSPESQARADAQAQGMLAEVLHAHLSIIKVWLGERLEHAASIS